jgi:Uma2 family endonuclease
MKAVQPRLTYPELRMMPDDGKRYELIDGEVFVTPSPSEKHQRILVNLLMSMQAHAKARGLGRVYVAPFDVVFGEKTALQPDLLFVSSPRRGIIGPEYVLGAPDLVVEILSPYRVPYDRVTKFEQYAQNGVGEYWIIDPVAESVDVFRLAGSSYELVGSVTGDRTLETPLLPGWKMPVRDLFAA